MNFKSDIKHVYITAGTDCPESHPRCERSKILNG